MKIPNVIAAGLAAALLLPSAPVAAQSTDDSLLSATELKQRFSNQVRTRGLVLAPSAGTAAPAGDGAQTSVAPAAAEEFVRIAPENQVNIQISFDFDSAALREDQKPKLATLCDVLKDIDIALFRIVGHTDASGSAAYNRQLSSLRAEEVKRFLVGDCGIAADRLEAVGAGEEFPLDPSDPSSGENRRVEFQALS